MAIFMKLNMNKCEVLPLGRKSLLQWHRLGAARLGSSSAPRESLGTLVVLVGSELDMSPQCVPA